MAPTQGPCANPRCKDRENPTGQFTLLPQEFLDTDPALFGDSGAHCGKRPCRRWCGKLPPIGQARGCATAGSGAGSGSPVPAVLLDEAGPRPSTIVSIKEIWAERCAACPMPARVLC